VAVSIGAAVGSPGVLVQCSVEESAGRRLHRR
jgi:propanediol dehydratase large subunit